MNQVIPEPRHHKYPDLKLRLNKVKGDGTKLLLCPFCNYVKVAGEKLGQLITCYNMEERQLCANVDQEPPSGVRSNRVWKAMRMHVERCESRKGSSLPEFYSLKKLMK